MRFGRDRHAPGDRQHDAWNDQQHEADRAGQADHDAEQQHRQEGVEADPQAVGHRGRLAVQVADGSVDDRPLQDQPGQGRDDGADHRGQELAPDPLGRNRGRGLPLEEAEQHGGEARQHHRQHREGDEVAAQHLEGLLDHPPEIELAARIAHRAHLIARPAWFPDGRLVDLRAHG
jgi:hypothetical protein